VLLISHLGDVIYNLAVRCNLVHRLRCRAVAYMDTHTNPTVDKALLFTTVIMFHMVVVITIIIIIIDLEGLQILSTFHGHYPS
jgi:hypothetical protein